MGITRHGQKIVKLESLKLPGDIRVRMKEPHVLALADSYKATGGRPMNAPWVDKETGRVVAGRDRAAAMMVAGIKESHVEHVSGDPIDLARATIIENFHRRLDDRQKLAKQLAEIEEGQIQQEDADPKPAKDGESRSAQFRAGSANNSSPAPKNRKGRPSGSRSKALGKVATNLGITPSAARALVRRAEEKEPEKQEAAKPVAPPVKTFGQAIPPEILARIEKEQGLIDKIGKLLAEAKRVYTELESLRGVARFEGNRHIGSSFRTAINELNALKLTRPESVCPYCKMVPELMKSCASCRGHGYVDVLGIKDVHPAYLQEGDDAIVAAGGKEVPLSRFSADDF
jgi:hypothetical protein